MKIKLMLDTDDGTIYVSAPGDINCTEIMVLGQENDPAKLLRIVKTESMSEMILQLATFFGKATGGPVGKISFGEPIPPEMIDFLLKHRLDLSVSTRLYNCLKAAGVSRVYEIFTMADQFEKMRWRNFGKKSRTELCNLLCNVGFTDDIIPMFQARIKPKWKYLTTLPVSEITEIIENPLFKRLLELSGLIFDFSKEPLGSFLDRYSFMSIFSSNFHDKYTPNKYEEQVTIDERREIRELLEKITFPAREFCDKEIIALLV